jgi:catechol 2,3-dioxygenase-like lactoylglutathione lyase family enzyme
VLRGIDHLVILVQRLDDAIATYRGLGFQVVPGGEHPSGTHNALVGFSDGSYLELIAFQEPERPSQHRWHRFLAPGGGLVDFGLRADDVEEEIDRLRGAGLEYTLQPGARRRPDGQELAWRLANPPSDRTGELPFLIDDVTRRELRVPSGEQAMHPNGVIGVRSLAIAVRDLDEATAEFHGLLGRDADASGPGMGEDLDARTQSFTVGQQQIVLAYPASPSSPLTGRIQRLGDGPFQAVLVARGGVGHSYGPNEAEGARLVIVTE